MELNSSYNMYKIIINLWLSNWQRQVGRWEREVGMREAAHDQCGVGASRELILSSEKMSFNFTAHLECITRDSIMSDLSPGPIKFNLKVFSLYLWPTD